MELFEKEMEIMGNIVFYVMVSVIVLLKGVMFFDMDIFVIFCYIFVVGKEVFYIGIVGDFVFLMKGWLRVSF